MVQPATTKPQESNEIKDKAVGSEDGDRYSDESFVDNTIPSP